MKVLSMLLSMYVLYMVSLPCVDEAIDFNKTFIEVSTAHHHHHDSNQTDACSPFCVCSCCSVTVDLTTFVFETNPARTLQSQLIPYYKESFSTYFQPIWQPPQLS
jgi:hypothetical protein